MRRCLRYPPSEALFRTRLLCCYCLCTCCMLNVEEHRALCKQRSRSIVRSTGLSWMIYQNYDSTRTRSIRFELFIPGEQALALSPRYADYNNPLDPVPSLGCPGCCFSFPWIRFVQVSWLPAHVCVIHWTIRIDARPCQKSEATPAAFGRHAGRIFMP